MKKIRNIMMSNENTEKKYKTNKNQTHMLEVGSCSFYLLYFSL
ncbi:hypothetical protein PQ796_01860 (plasmid) [Priestia megaterium]|nr:MULTISPECIES: hypothetical protein [Priestia]MDP9580406.1 hypothetical protein [Bacillus sp. 1751]MDH2449343.1 hypothetical protein [Priestia megaterium]MDL5148801.1 hypothetical protein [Priestia megaterium]MDP9726484.1 hypothetical protein [Priestia aryabhattai]MED4030348.1 hypothetical protein [Priestia megaterium]